MGYEMYRLLNYATEAYVKTPSKKPKKKKLFMEDSDNDSSDNDQEWLKKTSKTKAEMNTIEKYRK